MPRKTNAIIIIDGSNFYFKLKSLKLKNHLNFNFSAFAKELLNNRNLLSATYYIGKVKTDQTKKSQKLHKSQQKLLSNLRKHNFQYKLGYLLKSNGRFHEKGVDTQMAVDILVTAYEKIAKHIILISSDTDLLPAINKAQELGVTVEYVGFSHEKSTALLRNCKKSILLKKKDLKKFL